MSILKFFKYIKRLKFINTNLKIYYYNIYKKRDTVEKIILRTFIKLLISYFFYGLIKSRFNFTVNLYSKTIDEGLSQTIYDRTLQILEINKFHVPVLYKYTSNFIFNIM